MTGAALPENAVKVVRVEYTEESGGNMHVITPEPYDNIIRKGENLKRGDGFMPPKRLGPGDIGSPAASGVNRVDVFRLLKTGIIITGSELREPGSELVRGEIYNSSGIQLSRQIRAAGVQPLNYGIVQDNPDELAEGMEFRPVKISGGPVDAHGIEAVNRRSITPVRYMGSAHLNALAETDGFVVMEPGRKTVEKG